MPGRPPKHGGEAAVKAIQHGEPFRDGSPAAVEEVKARELLESEGPTAALTMLSARMLAAAELYWGALATAAENKDLKAMDKYLARFGWLATSTGRLLAELRKVDKASDRSRLAKDALQAAKEARHGQ